MVECLRGWVCSIKHSTSGVSEIDMCDDVCLIEHSTLPHSRDRSVYGMDVNDVVMRGV